MADNDLELHVKTTADLAALKQAEDELNRFYGSAHPGETSKLSAPIPEELLKPGGAFGEGAAGYEGLTHAAAEAQRFGVNLARARNEAVTLVRELAAGAPVSRTLGALLGTLGVPIAAAVGAGIALNKAITFQAEEQLKINNELDQQLTKVNDLSHKWTELAKNTTTPADVAKVAQGAIPVLDEVATKIRAVQNEQTVWWKTIVDSIVKAPTLGGTVFERDWQKRLNLLQQDQQEIAKSAAAAIKLAQEYQKTFDARKIEPASQALSEVTSRIEKLLSDQEKLSPLSATYAKDWSRIQNEISENEKQLSSFIDLGKEQLKISDENATAYEKTADEISLVQSALEAMGVHAKTAADAFNAGLKSVEPIGAAIRKLASEWANLQAQQVKTLQTDLTKGPMSAFQDSLNRQREFQERIAAQRELAAEGVGKEVSAAEKKKFFQEDELRQLQRTQALQRSLIPEGADQSEMQKRLGSEGIKEFEARAERIKELQQELGNIPKPRFIYGEGETGTGGPSMMSKGELPRKPYETVPEQKMSNESVVKAIEELGQKMDNLWR